MKYIKLFEFFSSFIPVVPRNKTEKDYSDKGDSHLEIMKWISERFRDQDVPGIKREKKVTSPEGWVFDAEKSKVPLEFIEKKDNVSPLNRSRYLQGLSMMNSGSSEEDIFKSSGWRIKQIEFQRDYEKKLSDLGIPGYGNVGEFKNYSRGHLSSWYFSEFYRREIKPGTNPKTRDSVFSSDKTRWSTGTLEILEEFFSNKDENKKTKEDFLKFLKTKGISKLEWEHVTPANTMKKFSDRLLNLVNSGKITKNDNEFIEILKSLLKQYYQYGIVTSEENSRLPSDAGRLSPINSRDRWLRSGIEYKIYRDMDFRDQLNVKLLGEIFNNDSSIQDLFSKEKKDAGKSRAKNPPEEEALKNAEEFSGVIPNGKGSPKEEVVVDLYKSGPKTKSEFHRKLHKRFYSPIEIYVNGQRKPLGKDGSEHGSLSALRDFSIQKIKETIVNYIKGAEKNFDKIFTGDWEKKFPEKFDPSGETNFSFINDNNEKVEVAIKKPFQVLTSDNNTNKIVSKNKEGMEVVTESKKFINLKSFKDFL